MNPFSSHGLWRSLLDILLLYIMIYFILLRVRGTRTLQVMRGMMYICFLFLIAWWLELETINTLRSVLFIPLVVAVLVIMAPELRHALVDFRPIDFLYRYGSGVEEQVLRKIARTAERLSAVRWGALIVIEREASLDNIADTGTRLSHDVQADLICTIFTPNSPLHDGAVLISGTKIIAAACLLPLSEGRDLSLAYGTRHRAALGLSEQLDALVVVVSEETGAISLAVGGNMTRNLDATTLEEVLQSIMEGEA
jgi:diadenylate cyclase